jgi:hypothetical protein
MKRNNTLITATKLALKFSENSDIPERFKNDEKTEKENEQSEAKKSDLRLLFERPDVSNNNKKKRQRINKNSKVEKRFQRNVRIWKSVIETMLQKISNEKAWRFIRIAPKIEPRLNSVTLSQDFIDFTKYVILRRNIEQCNCDELGFLCMLYTEFQRKLEQSNQISNAPSTIVYEQS